MAAALCWAWAALAAPGARAFWWGPRASSSWAARPVAVDGSSDDWDLDKGGGDAGLRYAFANDSSDLYVVLRANTEQASREMLGEFGQAFSVWLDAGAAKRKLYGVVFQPPGEGGGEDEGPSLIIERAGEGPLRIPPGGRGVSVRLERPRRKAVFEARVPLKELGVVLPADIAVCFELAAPDPVLLKRLAAERERLRRLKAERAMREGFPAQGGVQVRGLDGAGTSVTILGGDADAGAGADGQGTRQGAGSRDMASLPVPTELWVKVRLAKQP